MTLSLCGHASRPPLDFFFVLLALRQANPGKYALMICVELSSVHTTFDDNINDAILHAIFADGCAAAVMKGARKSECPKVSEKLEELILNGNNLLVMITMLICLYTRRIYHRGSGGGTTAYLGYFVSGIHGYSSVTNMVHTSGMFCFVMTATRRKKKHTLSSWLFSFSVGHVAG